MLFAQQRNILPEVDNILNTAGADKAKPKAEEQKVNIEEAKWGEDDDSLGSLDEELDAQAATEPTAGADAAGGEVEEPEIFVPPSPGPDPY